MGSPPSCQKYRNRINYHLRATILLRHALKFSTAGYIEFSVHNKGEVVQGIMCIGFFIPFPDAFFAGNFILLMESDIEPGQQIRGAVLTGYEPGHIMVQDFGIPTSGGSGFPFDRIEGIADIFGTKCRCHSETFGRNLGIELTGVRRRNSIQTENSIHNKKCVGR